MLTPANRAQRKALHGLYRRITQNRPPYREFRRLVQPMLMGDGAIILPWCGMWIAVETDGYTHS